MGTQGYVPIFPGFSPRSGMPNVSRPVQECNNQGIMKVLAVVFIASIALFAAELVEIPQGTVLHLRLITPVASNHSKPHDRLEAVVVSPYPGVVLHGRITGVKQAKGDERAYLDLAFEHARLIEVDNARESVEKSGRVVGIRANESLAPQLDWALEKLSEKYSDVGGVLQAVKALLIKDVDPEIVYPAGVEMTVMLTKPLRVERQMEQTRAAEPADPDLTGIVERQPARTRADRPALPSDWTNLLFIGSQPSIENAFKAAGWTPAQQINVASVLQTARAIIEARGYREAPVSRVRLEGRLADLVFQKINNTFAKRHHLRIWRRPENWHGREMWIAAATHDNGIAFASDERTFYHTIDSE